MIVVCLYRFREVFVLTGWHGALMCFRLPLQSTRQTPRPNVIRDAPSCQHRQRKREGRCVRPVWKFQHWERALVPPMSQLSCNFDSCWCYTTHKESSCVRWPFRVNFERRCISEQELTSLHSVSYRNFYISGIKCELHIKKSKCVMKVCPRKVIRINLMCIHISYPRFSCLLLYCGLMWLLTWDTSLARR